MLLFGVPIFMEWICEKCFKKTNNYGTDLKEQEALFTFAKWEF